MPAQLDFYAASRSGLTAIVRRSDDLVLAWVTKDANGMLLARERGTGRLLTAVPASTIPELIAEVAAHIAR